MDELENFSVGKCFNYARNNEVRFRAVTDEKVNLLKPNLATRNQIKEAVKFYVANNENLSKLLVDYNNDVLDEIELHISTRANKYTNSNNEVQEQIACLFIGLRATLNDNPSRKLLAKHFDNVGLLKLAFKVGDITHLYKSLKQAKSLGRDAELKGVMKSIKRLEFSDFSISTPRILYINSERGYQLVLEGAKIFLYTGKPFEVFNDKLKEEIIDFTSIGNRHFYEFKSSLSTMVGGLTQKINDFQILRKLKAKISYLEDQVGFHKKQISLVTKGLGEIEACAAEKLRLEEELQLMEEKLFNAQRELIDLPEDRSILFT
jgi:CII-binding regulator of phage lambda lysogenization HflD